jgi:HD-like signal output (HDOD) protein/ActR/RegA family two-component response regulator
MNDVDRCAVLFVDDEPLVLQGLQRSLRSERWSWRVGFAESGREALGILERESFDAVVTDLRMPEMDGAELLGTVMERHPHMVRIVLSGEMDPGMIMRAVPCAHQFLAKPCDAQALKATLARAFALKGLVSDRRLRALLARLQTLPSLPGLYGELIAEIQAPNSSFRRVGDLISRDVGMAAKVLQLVNSAFFGIGRRILNPQEAVSLLGYDTVKALVLSAKIFSQFDSGQTAHLPLEALWHHSLSVGLCGRTIGTAEKLPRKAQDEAFTAGILHDVGKLVLARNFPEAYAQVMSTAHQGRQTLWEVETDCFGVSHAEVGAYLMGLWGLGAEVVAAIAHHHRPPRGASPGPVLGVVFAANALEHRPFAEPGDASGASVTEDDLKQLNIAGRFAAWEEVWRRNRLEEALHAE